LQKNNRIFYFLLAILISGLARAERSSGYCSVSEDEKGKEVLYIYPGTEFMCVESSALRYRIWIEALVQTEKLYDGLRLTEKTKIYDLEGKLLGKISASFNPMKLLEERDTMTHIVISGYLEKNCIDQKYVPEIDLSALLDKAENNEKFSYFESFLDKYEFTETIENNLYKSYLLEQPDFVRQGLCPRLLLVFYRNELIAIFHTLNVRVKRYDSIEMGSQYKMIYNSKFSEHTKKEMVEIYKNKIK
jgi:hypothetical protein